MKVCVGIVTRGRAELAEKAVASALSQVPPPDLVWVIEDGLVGKPFSWEKGGPVRITSWTEPKGFMAGRHQMMMEAEADVYVSLDDDAWFLDPQAMAEAVRVMESDSKVAAVGFEILSPDCPQPLGKKGAEPAKMFIGCGHALRLQAVREVGGYEEMPGFYGGEEKDLCLRLINQNWKVVKLFGWNVWHEVTTRQRNLEHQRRASITNDLAIVFLRAPVIAMIPYILGTIINHFRYAFFRKASFKARLFGLIDFAENIPQLARKRKPVSLKCWCKVKHEKK
jgi:GT2 family glycosyltransferase